MENVFDKIYKYGEEVLAKEASEVKNFDENLTETIKRMQNTMYIGNGVGLAAPQIGLSLKLLVVDPTAGEDKSQFFSLINPEILEKSGSEAGEEGCLSVPGINLVINRSTRIKVKSRDINNNPVENVYEGYVARIIQHEIDHLHGKVIVDRVSPLKRQLAKKQIKRLKKNGEW